MNDRAVLLLGGSLSLGIAAQWLAWRFRMPSILLLLLSGVLAGPVLGILHPRELVGGLLAPMVSLSVAIVLFEGGLSLKLHELRIIGRVVLRLLTTGALVSWLIIAAAAHYVAHLNLSVAAVLGAVLVVTGPTVIGPLLAQVRPLDRVASILRWEGILIDPIGAILALLVYEGVVASRGPSVSAVAWKFAATVGSGLAIGLAVAFIFYELLRFHAIAEPLQSAVALMWVMLAYMAAQATAHEAGWVAVTAMGVALTNQETVNIRPVVEFKENLRVLLLAWLFVMLAAELDLTALTAHVWNFIAFFGVVVLVARPLAVWVSTVGSRTTWPERIFMASVAPRGIVAAAVSSTFSLRLQAAGLPQADQLVAIAFFVIIGTVALYGLAARPLVRLLGLGQPDPQGVLLLGAHGWARDLGHVLQRVEVPVTLVDSNAQNVAAARLAGLDAVHGNILSPAVRERVGAHIGRLLALTANDEVNTLATLHFAEFFGRIETYQLVPDSNGKKRDPSLPHHLHGRYLFSGDATFRVLDQRFRRGDKPYTTQLTPEFDFEAFRELHGNEVLPLFCVGHDEVRVFTAENVLTPHVGDILICLRSPAQAGKGGSSVW